MEKTWDVVVVGGGLAGLAAAAYLGRAGLRAAVIEKAKEVGGRARTTAVEASGGAGAATRSAGEKGSRERFMLNLGAHAVYRKWHAWGVLEELGVPLEGGIPKASGSLALANSGVHALPTGLLSLLTTGLLGLGGKMELGKVLASIGGIDATSLVGVPASEWIERTVKAPEARAFLRGFFRVSTYTGDLDRLSAGAAIAQLQTVSKHNVLYLDGGWQTLVEALRDRATQAGATILAGDGAAKIERENADDSSNAGRDNGGHAGGGHAGGGHAGGGRAGGEWRVTLHDGQVLRARAVLLATGPHAAAALVPSAEALARFAAEAVPVKVATLDVALTSLPRKGRNFGLGTDRPTYVSVHSAVAKLAPEGGAVVHAMLYEPSGDARADEREVEAALDEVQPGWRDVVAHRRFLPAMVVANDTVCAARGGLAGRPDVAVPGTEGLFLAGDWVGPDGMLLDAVLASAKHSAAACASHLATTRTGGADAITKANGTSARARAGEGAHDASAA